MQRITTGMFMLICMALSIVWSASVHADGKTIDVALEDAHITKHLNAGDIGESVGVWIKSDGGIVVTGRNPEGLPSEVMAKGYSFMTKGAPQGGIVDLRKLQNNMIMVKGVSDGDLLKAFFSAHETNEQVDPNNVTVQQGHAKLDGNGMKANDYSHQESKLYQVGLLQSVRNFHFDVQNMSIGQFLPGMLSLMACGSALFWMFRRSRKS